MSDTSKIIIEITKSGARIESVSLTGGKNVKTVAVADLASVFAKNTVLDTGLLPTLDGVAYYGQHSDKELVVYTGAPRVRELTFHVRRGEERDRGQKTFQVPVPRTYLFMALQANRETGTKKIVGTNMYAASNVVRNKTSQLLAFPFCNVYENRNICWGANTLSPIRELYGVQHYYDLFWSSPFNGDLERNIVPQFHYDPSNGQPVSRDTGRAKSVTDTLSYFQWANLAKASQFDASSLPAAGSFNEAVARIVG